MMTLDMFKQVLRLICVIYTAILSAFFLDTQVHCRTTVFHFFGQLQLTWSNFLVFRVHDAVHEPSKIAADNMFTLFLFLLYY